MANVDIATNLFWASGSKRADYWFELKHISKVIVFRKKHLKHVGTHQIFLQRRR